MDTILDKVSVIDSKILITTVCGLVAAVYTAKHLNSMRLYGRADYRPLFNPIGLFGVVLTHGLDYFWRHRRTFYSEYKRDIVVVEPLIHGETMLLTNSIEVLREVASDPLWFKPDWSLIVAAYWGHNIVSANGQDWKRQRRIIQPAFNPRAYKQTWNEAQRFYQEMLRTENWPTTTGNHISIEDMRNHSQRLALCVILSIGFGIPVSWDKSPKTLDGRMMLEEPIRVQAENLVLTFLMPRWMLRIPTKHIQYVRQSLVSLRDWFNGTLAARKAKIADLLELVDKDIDSEHLPGDVFSRIVLASQADAKNNLLDSEIIGNVWILYFAGHETTAGSIAATLTLLAGFQTEQDQVYEEIAQIIKSSDDGMLHFEDYESLIKTRCAFVEATRMYPPAQWMIREALEDRVIRVPTTNENGETVVQSMPVVKGTIILIDAIGAHYNPRTFPSPDKFVPSRWYNSSSDEAYTTFSAGPRACVGRKLALVEAVCFLANLLKDYRVEPLLNDGEDEEGWRKRVLEKATVSITLNIETSPLKFTRR
ncbi:hypothetical protein PIIN_02300 [Serendipita indica DSM 11827]|uniref:Cytochrome P450 n=1 Tax=Serendipita indica (strain DSM 11827) TaxID=1109443 RepID=G4TAU6_SERID|nr:hypothetical protein PIIN_02300 [Serendipita indica DSM 11827]